MISNFIIAFALVAVTVIVHAVGLAVLLQAWINARGQVPTRAWSIIWWLLRVTWWLILIHLIEIAVWGMFFYWNKCLPDAESAFYFYGVTYTTVGYGDLVLTKTWRFLGPIEGLTGILMCGLSAGVFFAFVSRIYSASVESKRIKS